MQIRALIVLFDWHQHGRKKERFASRNDVIYVAGIVSLCLGVNERGDVR